MHDVHEDPIAYMQPFSCISLVPLSPTRVIEPGWHFTALYSHSMAPLECPILPCGTKGAFIVLLGWPMLQVASLPR